MVEPETGYNANFLKKVGGLRIDYSELIGEGSYARVYKGYLEENQSETLAVKEISLSPPTEDQKALQKLINNEIKITEKLMHNNIVAFKIAAGTKNNVYIATEYCPEGELQKSMDKIKGVEKALCCLKQIVEAMDFANSQNIIHRDLKPENILIKKGRIKICDFGLARFVNDPMIFAKMTGKKGNYQYMAPEVFNSKEYNSKCDVWAVGLIFYELIYKFLPWYGPNPQKLFKNIKENELKFYDEVISLDETIKDLLKKMLEKDENIRINFKDILEHAVFKKEIPNLLEF